MIICDIEASGLKPKESAIVSIGAVDFDTPDRQFYIEPRIFDGAHIDPDSLAVNGFTEEECYDPRKPSLEDAMKEFYEWLQPISEKTLVGQNVSFDRDFLNVSFGRAGISWHFSYRTLDIHSIAYVDHIHRGLEVPQENERTALNLDAILHYVGIPEEPKPHNALTGAKVEAEALSRMLYGKNLLPEFATYPVPEIFMP